MRTLLFVTEMNLGNQKKSFHTGVASLSAYLKERGHEVFAKVLAVPDFNRDELLDEIRRIDPGLIGLSIMTDEWFFIPELARFLKESLGIPIIAGGVHPTVSPEQVIANEHIDMLCLGEGEVAMEELCDCLERGKDPSKLENLWVKDGDTIYRNPIRPLIKDIDSLPFPDYEIIDYNEYLREHSWVSSVAIGRGCPFKCTYCVNSFLYSFYKGKGKMFRKRSPANAVAMLKGHYEKYPEIKIFGFQDDTLFQSRSWLKEFADLYRKEVGIPFSCFARIDRIDREFLALMKEACCASLILGIESGNEWLRTNVLERRMPNSEILEKCALVHEAGLHMVTLNMFGLPFETKEMAEETFELNKKISPHMCFAGPFRPYPGTALRKTCIAQGWIKEEDPFLDRRLPMMDLPGLSKEEITAYATRLNALGIRQHLEKMPVGSYDFLLHFQKAEVESCDPSLCVLTFECNDQDFLLRVAPLSRVSYFLQVPHNARIFFDISFESGKIFDDKVGALFAIEVERLGDGSNGKQRIFSRYIMHDEGWLDCEASLEGYYGQEVRISFITVPGPTLEDSMAGLYWRRPFVSSLPSLKDRS